LNDDFMTAPASFRDRGFRFALAIVQQYRRLVNTTDVPKHLAIQMLRAGTGIGANLQEAKSASSRRDLIAKNAIALREARECHFWLRLIQADQPPTSALLSPLLSECHELIAILAAAVRRLRSG
jgi:four helix bundle protein